MSNPLIASLVNKGTDELIRRCCPLTQQQYPHLEDIIDGALITEQGGAICQFVKEHSSCDHEAPPHQEAPMPIDNEDETHPDGAASHCHSLPILFAGNTDGCNNLLRCNMITTIYYLMMSMIIMTKCYTWLPLSLTSSCCILSCMQLTI